MKILNEITRLIALLVVIVMQFVFIPFAPRVQAASNPNLGTASTYSILSGTTVTNTGTTTISGDVGIYPTGGGGATGFGTVTLGGTLHDSDAAADTAQSDKNSAYTSLDSQSCDTSYAGTKDLAGETLVPGVYCANSFHLTGTLTLNGTSSDVWIFKSASDLILTGGTAVKILFTGGGQPCNVWWRVVSTATFDANSTFVGNILADTSITLAAGASLNGRALARTAEVTLSSNSISGPTCVSPTATPTPTPSSTSGSNSDGSSSAGGTAPCVAPNITTIPVILGSGRISPTSISINWGPYAGIDTFNVRYGLVNGNWLYNTNVTGFSTTINDLPSNQPIWTQVAATNNCVIGNYGEAKLVGEQAVSPNVLGVNFPNTGFAPPAKQ